MRVGIMLTQQPHGERAKTLVLHEFNAALMSALDWVQLSASPLLFMHLLAMHCRQYATIFQRMTCQARACMTTAALFIQSTLDTDGARGFPTFPTAGMLCNPLSTRALARGITSLLAAMRSMAYAAHLTASVKMACHCNVISRAPKYSSHFSPIAARC